MYLEEEKGVVWSVRIRGWCQSAEQAIVQRMGKLPHSKDAGTNV
jgi:hypothetical protein